MFSRTLRYLRSEIEAIKKFIENDEAELAELKENYNEFLEWKKMRDANEEAAAKMGHFYVTAEDSALLERLIQEVNKDPDLAVLMTNAQGTTTSLRSYPRPLNNKIDSAMNRFSTGE